MDISYDYYKTFYYVAKYRSVSKAAAAMQKGQPNITKTINRLEEQLGCRLFVRSPKGAFLTPEGEKLYAHMEIAMEHIQAGEQEIAADRSLQSGTVTVASSEIALRCYMLPILEQYRKRYPNVRIRLSNFTILQAIEAVKSSLADFAVVTEPEAVPKALECRKISGIQEILVCGETFRHLNDHTLSFEEFPKYPFVSLNTQTNTFRVLNAFFESNGIRLEPDIEVTTVDQILPLVRSNLGLGVVPETFVEQDGSQGIYRLSLEKPVPARAICLLRRKDSPLGIAAEELVRMLC